MKKNYKDFIIIITCLLFLYFTLLNNKLVSKTIIDTMYLGINKVFPSLFPMILINNILIDYNFPYYFTKIFKNKGIKIYTIILSLLSGSPSNAIIIKNMYENKFISLKEAKNLLSYTFFSNPIFLITMLSTFNNKIKLILISYSSNIIISLFFKIKNNNVSVIKNNNHNLSKTITKSIYTLVIIIGTIIFFILISTFITNIFNFNIILELFIKGLLEITQGLNILNKINIINKDLIALIFINFGGLSIHLQIKSILMDTPIKYKCFLFGRLLALIISITIYLMYNYLLTT